MQSNTLSPASDMHLNAIAFVVLELAKKYAQAAQQNQTVTTKMLEAMSDEQLCLRKLDLDKYLTRNNFIPARWRAPLDYKTKQLERARKSELIRLTMVANARGIELPKFTHDMGCMSEPEWKAFMAAHVISGIETDGSDSLDNRPTRTLEATQ